jgi:putative ABC transport system permease protein
MQHNIITALRHFRNSKFNLALNLISLILGLLICSAIILNAWQQLSTDRFIANSDRIFRLNCGGYGVTPPCFKDLLGSGIPEIEESLRLNDRDLEIYLNNEPVKIVKICYIDPNFMKVFGIKLIEGNQETALKDPFSLIITETTALKIFGQKQVLGKTITHNKKFVFTVTGLMKDFPSNSHLKINGLTSIHNLPIISEFNEKLDDCGGWGQLTYLLLNNSKQKAECEKKVNVLLEDHKMGTRDGKIPLRLEALTSIYFDAENNKFDGCAHGNLLIILSFLALGFFTLLIACINSINYSLAQSEQRFKELRVMRIYGASRKQITAKIMIEMVLMFQISGIISSVLLEISLSFFSSQIGFESGFPQNRLEYYFICLGVATVLGMIAGLFPSVYQITKQALLNSKTSEFHSKRTHKGILMILIQYLLAAVFMASTFIVTEQIDYMLKKDPGFNPENVLQIELDKTLGASTDYLKKKIVQISGVEKLAFSDAWIGAGFGKRPTGEKGKEIICTCFSVDPDYFDLMGIKIKDGRNYSWTNPTDTSNGIIMNETAARAFELISGSGKIFNNKILIGIAGDFNFFSLKNEIEPFIIDCMKGQPRIMSIRLKQDHQKEIREKILEICKGISPDFHNRISYVKESLQNLYSGEIKLSKGISLYAAVAFILSILGIIGICTIRLQKRRKEIAIRRILGASIMEINKLVLWDFIPWVLLANLISVPVTIYIARQWLQSYAYHTSISPVLFIVTAGIALFLTSIVVIIITTISSRTNPKEVLREE